MATGERITRVGVTQIHRIFYISATVAVLLYALVSWNVTVGYEPKVPVLPGATTIVSALIGYVFFFRPLQMGAALVGDTLVLRGRLKTKTVPLQTLSQARRQRSQAMSFVVVDLNDGSNFSLSVINSSSANKIDEVCSTINGWKLASIPPPGPNSGLGRPSPPTNLPPIPLPPGLSGPPPAGLALPPPQPPHGGYPGRPPQFPPPY